MNTIVKSPRRILEEELGITCESSRGLRNGDCHGDWTPLSCGDHIVDTRDERHVGEVRAISSSVWVIVRWLDTGWRSTLHIKRLRRI